MQMRNGGCWFDQASLSEILQRHFMCDEQLERLMIGCPTCIAKSRVVLDIGVKLVRHVIDQCWPIERLCPVPTPGFGLRYLGRHRIPLKQWRYDHRRRDFERFESRECLTLILFCEDCQERARQRRTTDLPEIGSVQSVEEIGVFHTRSAVEMQLGRSISLGHRVKPAILEQDAK